MPPLTPNKSELHESSVGGLSETVEQFKITLTAAAQSLSAHLQPFSQNRHPVWLLYLKSPLHHII
jgi:hypothetical protein